MACHTLDPTPSQPRVLTDPIGNGPSAKFSASSQANLTLMLEISPNDTSSSRCKGEENIPAGLINHLPVDIPRKRKLCDIQTSLTSKDISEETKKQMIQVGREQPRLTNDSRPLSFEDTNEIPQEMRHLIRDRLQKNSSKAEVDEKYEVANCTFKFLNLVTYNSFSLLLSLQRNRITCLDSLLYGHY
jgi:hypothetical protein